MSGLMLLLVAIALLAWMAYKERSLALAVLAVSFGTFYGIRSVGIVFGLDDPYPRYLFTATDLDSAMWRFGLVALLFCAGVAFAHSTAGGVSRAIARMVPVPRSTIKFDLLLAVTVLVTVVASLVAAIRVLEAGGVAAALSAAKSEREGGGAVLRMPATLALVLACGTFHSARRLVDGRITGRGARLVAGACVVAAALAASVWGSRQFTVVAAAYILGAPAIRAFRDARSGWLLRILLVLGSVIGLGFGLRLYRDAALGGVTAVTMAHDNVFRQVSIAVNGTSLDSSLLAVKDWPRHFDYRGGADFLDGLWGAVPSGLRPEGMVRDTIGANFHRIYEPGATSGWPIGAPTEWYINFGWLGVLIGGLLSGWIYAGLTLAMRRSPMPELATVSTMILAFVVFPLGLSSSSSNRAVVHAMPLLLLIWLLQAASRPPAERRHRAGRDPGIRDEVPTA